MIDAIVILLALSLGSWGIIIEPSAFILGFALVSAVFALAGLLFRRMSLVVVSCAVSAAGFLAAALSSSRSLTWQSLGFGLGALVFLELASDRITVLRQPVGARTYRRRALYLLECAATSAGAFFVAATLGYNAAVHLDRPVPFAGAVACAAIICAGAGVLLVRLVRGWDR